MRIKQRTCLKCGKTFESTGPGHRICKPCAQLNARIPISEEQLQKQRGLKRRNGEPLGDPAQAEAAGVFSDP